MNWIRRVLKRSQRPTQSANPTKNTLRYRPAIEALEDRTTPTASAVTTNFNGTAIPAGDALWFSSVAKVSGIPADGATVRIANATISGQNLGTVSVPNATIHFDPHATSASAAFDANGWEIDTPIQFSGNVFLDGVSVGLPSGLPGGIKNVVWTGDFTSDTAGLTINWQWAAAAYTNLSMDEAAIGVKPSDSPTPQYPNSDHAGAPENFKTAVIGGATGGGGSNFTGSYSATGHLSPEVSNPQVAATLSGFVFTNAPTGAATLKLYKLAGDGVTWALVDTTTTNAIGFYSFSDLQPGTYEIVLTPPAAPAGYTYQKTTAVTGNIDGMQDSGASPMGEVVQGVVLGSGVAGTDYDFIVRYINNG